MKKQALWLLLALLALSAPTAFATDCPINQGGWCLGGACFYEYVPATSCIEPEGDVYQSTMCYPNKPAWNTDENSTGYIYYSFIVDSGDQIGDTWEGHVDVSFYDPDDSDMSWVQFWAGVTRSGNTTWYLMSSHYGLDGDLYCNYLSGTFPKPQVGDRIIIEVDTSTDVNASIQVGKPIVFTY